MLGALTVDVVSDVVCPWCYIGKRRLASAIAQVQDAEPGALFHVRWHPFELNPDIPAEGIDRRQYLDAKFGGAERAREIYARVRSAGESAGIAFDLDAIARQANTLTAHRLIAWGQARPEGDADALVEGLFRACFEEGRDVGDRDVLVAVAVSAGFDPDDARAFLASDALCAEVSQASARARAMGIGGVPFFIFDGKLAVSGAQEPATLADAIRQARSG
jgi:predicted DsbA family dithiol-disulfide isomerase